MCPYLGWERADLLPWSLAFIVGAPAVLAMIFPGAADPYRFFRQDMMKLYRLSRTQLLPTDLEDAWAFFSNPRNLARITPPALDFRIVSDLPREIHPGLIVAYTLAPLLPGLRISWVTEITTAEKPWLFVDEQRFGPYRFWHHQHHFRSLGDGVEMRDLVHYRLPLGLFGLLAAPLVQRRLQAIFDFRRDFLARLDWK